MGPKNFVVGLKWKKLGYESHASENENEDIENPGGEEKRPKAPKESALKDLNGVDAVRRLVRMNSVRDAFGSIREVIYLFIYLFITTRPIE
jgi:hypothetical protein